MNKLSLEYFKLRLPRWHSSKESACQYRRRKSHGFDPWVRKIPCRKAWQPTLVFLPGESQGQRNLMSYTVPGVTKNQTPLKQLSTML